MNKIIWNPQTVRAKLGFSKFMKKFYPEFIKNPSFDLLVDRIDKAIRRREQLFVSPWNRAGRTTLQKAYNEYEKEYLIVPVYSEDDRVEVSHRPWIDNVKDYFLTKEQREVLLKDWSVIVSIKQDKRRRPSD